jgi:hypothetical protein
VLAFGLKISGQIGSGHGSSFGKRVRLLACPRTGLPALGAMTSAAVRAHHGRRAAAYGTRHSPASSSDFSSRVICG